MCSAAFLVICGHVMWVDSMCKKEYADSKKGRERAHPLGSMNVICNFAGRSEHLIFLVCEWRITKTATTHASSSGTINNHGNGMSIWSVVVVIFCTRTDWHHHQKMTNNTRWSFLIFKLYFIHTTRIHTGVIAAVHVEMKLHRTCRVMVHTDVTPENHSYSYSMLYCLVLRSTKYYQAEYLRLLI